MRTRSIPSGATLLFGPDRPRPDLVLAAQFLIDDLRAAGQRIGSLRVGDNLMRLRLDGLELALALSPGPLPPHAIAGPLRLPPGAQHTSDLPDIGMTDLRAIRTLRLMRRHRHALGVLLRRRGLGPEDLDAALHPMLLAMIEAAPPDLILWQRTGVLWTAPEFQGIGPARLAQAGPPLRALPAPPADGAERRMERLPVLATRPAPPASRQDRSARRSLGRLFDAGRPAAPLPRIEPASARLTEALRQPPEGEGEAPAATGYRRRVLTLVLAVWLLLGPWPVGGLQAMLP
jgi:hypothetical protein